MTLIEAYREDLRELVARLDENGVFAPGEREAWDEGIDEADEMNELMMTGESLHEAMADREGVDEVVGEHAENQTQAFV
ncbi:hypothetical protein [Halorubrum salinum]|uniref:hypothetical protein n=1 Tax=Halorubrum salinum TaxID=767517 RepID=UPI0021117C9E|nr:hypothetical protein [Halorubrum salinum]